MSTTKPGRLQLRLRGLERLAHEVGDRHHLGALAHVHRDRRAASAPGAGGADRCRSPCPAATVALKSSARVTVKPAAVSVAAASSNEACLADVGHRDRRGPVAHQQLQRRVAGRLRADGRIGADDAVGRHRLVVLVLHVHRRSPARSSAACASAGDWPVDVGDRDRRRSARHDQLDRAVVARERPRRGVLPDHDVLRVVGVALDDAQGEPGSGDGVGRVAWS